MTSRKRQAGASRTARRLKAVSVVEAKPAGTTLSGVAEQSAGYPVGLPGHIPHVQLPLPFAYESTGAETFFRDERDLEPRSRRLFAFHRPETRAEWAGEAGTLRARGGPVVAQKLLGH